jgi:molybdopterin/thiamine biosynthesis adenylyltransferase
MQDQELLRYSRHLLLNEIGVEGQQRVSEAHVLIIGAGGLGSPAALYLGSAGVGTITVVDDDEVDLTNLQRQVAHTMARIGCSKVSSIAAAVAAINPDVRIHPIQQRADAPLLDLLVEKADVVLDCCDNFVSRHAINAACMAHNKPLVSGAAIRFDAQITVYDPRSVASPCYACVFPADATFEETRCATMGVFAPLVGIIGTMQAAEALKLICGVGKSLMGRLLMLDGRAMEFTELRLTREPNCPVCSKRSAPGDTLAQRAG